MNLSDLSLEESATLVDFAIAYLTSETDPNNERMISLFNKFHAIQETLETERLGG